VNIKNYNQRSTRIGILDGDSLDFIGIKNIPLGQPDGDKMVAESGIWKRELRLTETGLREELVIAERPSIPGVGLKDWLVLETQVSGVNLSNGWLSDFKVDKYNFPVPKAHDANGDYADNCKRYVRNNKIYTGVPVSWLASAEYPVVIDPDVYFYAAASYCIYGESSNYNVARSTADATQEDFYVGQYVPGGVYRVNRGLLKFDTSSLQTNIAISSLKLRLTAINVYEVDNSYDIQIVKADWSDYDPISSADDDAFDLVLSADADDNIFANSADLSDDDYEMSGELDPDWVNKTGYTYYGLRSSRDKSNSEPTNSEFTSFYRYDAANSADRPELYITYELQPSAFFLMT
jgi:hypothetical protein